MELWDLYTKDKQPTGRTMFRGEKNPEGLYNLGVYVWIRNQEGKYLISMRSGKKKTYPLKWETVGGCVLSGETSLEGAVRELHEEVGLVAQPNRLEIIFSLVDPMWNGRIQQEIDDVYLYWLEGAFDAKSAMSDEVEECRWMSADEIRECFRTGEFIDVLEPIFEQVDSIRQKGSTYDGKSIEK